MDQRDLRLRCSDIPEGDCDCDGNQLDALGDAAVLDMDGICDDVDPCVGELDDCGVCNGSGAIYDCGCVDIPEGDCDCDGNQLGALGECGGPCAADVNDNGICDTNDVYGCTARSLATMTQRRRSTMATTTSLLLEFDAPILGHATMRMPITMMAPACIRSYRTLRWRMHQRH